MTVQVRLFADIREAVGESEVEATGDTVEEVLSCLVERNPSLKERLFNDGELRQDVNLMADGKAAELGTPTEDIDEVAVYPPVSGGVSPTEWVRGYPP